MTIRLRYVGLGALAFVAALATSAAHAIVCLPTPHYRYVGSDGQCNDHDLHSAILHNATDCPGTTIVLTNQITYTNISETIDNRSVTIAGSSGGCGTVVTGGIDAAAATIPVPLVTLTAPTTGGSVFTITGNSHVLLQSLEITGAVPSLGYSGGVSFDGTGSLSIVGSNIHHNAGVLSGGIYFNGQQSAGATLTIGTGTTIRFNTSSNDGGGISMRGNARLFVLAPSTQIGYNHADSGNGGGIALIGTGTVHADIGANGPFNSPVVTFNTALNGGGIALVGYPSAPPRSEVSVRLFSTDSAHAVQVSGNTATGKGGAIYIEPSWNPNGAPAGPIFASLCAHDFRIEDNYAPEGNAIYSTYGHDGTTITGGAGIQLNPPTGCHVPDSDAPLGAVICARGATCNTIDANGATDFDGNPTSNAVIFTDLQTDLAINRVRMRGNAATFLVHAIGSHPSIDNCLMVENILSQAAIHLENSSSTTVENCTFSRNMITGPGVMLSTNKTFGHIDANHYYLQNGIIDQPGVPIFAGTDGSTFYPYEVMSSDPSTPPQIGMTIADPLFVDAAGSDYHLQRNSPAVDFAAMFVFNGEAVYNDLDGAPRAYDLPDVMNHLGPRDLGAYEIAPACYRLDTIACNGFDP